MATNYSPRIVRDGLVLCLDANNSKSYPGTGITWSDLSGNGNHATNAGYPSYTTNIYYGAYFSYDDTDDVSLIANSASLNMTTGLTIESIVMFYANSQDFIFEKGNVNTQYSLFSHGDDVVFRTKHVGDSTYDSLDITKASLGVSNNTWHHIVGTWNGTTKQLYIDGVGKNTQSKSGNLVTTTPGAAVGRFGGTSTGYYFGGNIAKVAVYNRGLSANEVAQNFAALRGRYGI